jgi:hypothetical protein
MPHRQRFPVSVRHAFALAFDLAFRRDPLHSLVIPFLLRAPWVLVFGALPPIAAGRERIPGWLVLLGIVLLLGDFLTLLVVSGMLRFRARSVFNTAPDVAPMAAGEGYRLAFRRVPWLVTTEVVRNLCLGLAASLAAFPASLVRVTMEGLLRDLGRNVMLMVVTVCLALPVVLFGCRLGVATEAVVLDDHDLAGAFIRSMRVMTGRFERWFELIVASGMVVLTVALLCAVMTLVSPVIAGPAGVTVLWLLVVFISPVIQYAWAFFYLRLREGESVADEETSGGGVTEAEEAAGVRPALRLIAPTHTGPAREGPPGE